MTRIKAAACIVAMCGLGALTQAGCETGQDAATTDGVVSLSAAPSRNFEFSYTTTVDDIPAGARSVNVWMPVPQTDENQEISNVRVRTSAGLTHQITTEKTYGNKVLHVTAPAGRSLPRSLEVTLTVDVLRHETGSMKSIGSIGDRSALLGNDSMAPITDEVRSRSAQATAGGATKVAKARGIYDRVLTDVDYDKSGVGWGKGDVQYVCDIGKGNCSDFHTLFIGMSRAAKIPSYFEIGFPLPPDKTAGTIGGYHCWAWYQGDGGVWHPVDASEADKHPEQTDYFFNTICCNRVAFSRGRDLQLSPAPASGTVNFFVYPVVEIDGVRADDKVTKKFRFRDL